MENLQDYIVIIPTLVCLCITYILKHVVAVKAISRFIPLIMGVVGILMNMWLNWNITPAILLGGLLSGLASTGLYEAFQNVINKKE